MKDLKKEIKSIADRLIEIEELRVLNSEADSLNLGAIISLCKIVEISGSILKNKE